DRVRKRPAREAALDPCLGRRDHDRGGGLHEVVEALQARGDGLARGRERLEGRHLARRQVVDAAAERPGTRRLAQEEAQVGGERVCAVARERSADPQGGTSASAGAPPPRPAQARARLRLCGGTPRPTVTRVAEDAGASAAPPPTPPRGALIPASRPARSRTAG